MQSVILMTKQKVQSPPLHFCLVSKHLVLSLNFHIHTCRTVDVLLHGSGADTLKWNHWASRQFQKKSWCVQWSRFSATLHSVLRLPFLQSCVFWNQFLCSSPYLFCLWSSVSQNKGDRKKWYNCKNWEMCGQHKLEKCERKKSSAKFGACSGVKWEQ